MADDLDKLEKLAQAAIDGGDLDTYLDLRDEAKTKFPGQVYKDDAGWTWFEQKGGKLSDTPFRGGLGEDMSFDSVAEFRESDPDVGIWREGDELDIKRNSVPNQPSAQDYMELARREVEPPSKQKMLADRMRKAGMSVVKGAGPKLAALMGGPLGMGVAIGSTLLDAKDAYAGIESTMNPETDEEKMRQKYLADLMRRNELP